MESTDRASQPRAARRAVRAAVFAAALTSAALVFLAVAPVGASSSAMSPACSGVNVRRAATTSSTIAVTLGATAALTVSGTVSGAAWGTSCPTWKSGRTWYVVTAINGVAVSSRYGAELLYAATGVLKAAPISAPTPPPSASPKPTASTTASPPATAAQSPAATATRRDQAAGSPDAGHGLQWRERPSRRNHERHDCREARPVRHRDLVGDRLRQGLGHDLSDLESGQRLVRDHGHQRDVGREPVRRLGAVRGDRHAQGSRSRGNAIAGPDRHAEAECHGRARANGSADRDAHPDRDTRADQRPRRRPPAGHRRSCPPAAASTCARRPRRALRSSRGSDRRPR